jgi:hypothetical protein
MTDSPFDRFRERIGLDGVPADQPIWRFLDLGKTKDLLQTSDLYMRRVSLLRKDDDRESKLPDVLQETIQNGQLSQTLKRFYTEAHQICENQADSVYASCWFIPGAAEHEERMWRKYGGDISGGIRLESTIALLGASLPDYDFGLGMIRHIDANINFAEAFDHDQYRSVPFLLKLAKHHEDHEIRLFARYRGLLTGRRIVPHPNRFERSGLRVRIYLRVLIQKIRLSPICSEQTRNAICEEFTTKGVPRNLFDEQNMVG